MIHGNRFAYQAVGAIVIVAALFGVSCAATGSKKLVSSHTAYNDAVQLTVTREVLSNIVRSRYVDPIQFMAVSAVNAQFSVSAGGSGSVAGIGAAGAAGDLGASLGYSSSPTITYVPLSDAGFYKSIMNPLAVEEAIGFGLQYRSARLDPSMQALSLRLSFGSINGANDFVAGRYNELYIRRVDAIVRLLQLGATYRQVPEWDYNTTSIPKEKVTAEDMVDAFQWGLYFVEEEDGKSVRLARYRLVLALIMPDPDDPEVAKALVEIGVKPGRSRYVFRPPMHSVPDYEDAYAIWVTPRSMLDMLSLAARVVDVPVEHESIVPIDRTLARRAGEPPRGCEFSPRRIDPISRTGSSTAATGSTWTIRTARRGCSSRRWSRRTRREWVRWKPERNSRRWYFPSVVDNESRMSCL